MFNGMNGLEILKNWPRYESGELVPIGGEFMGKDGKAYTAKQIQFIGKCFSLYDFCDRKPQFNGFYGERVKRPAVLAADGEPLEVGQTVWDANGDELVIVALEDGGRTVTCRYADVGDGIPTHGMWSPSDLTHTRPVLDADGNRIEPAMDVWWVCEGDERGVHAERLHVDGIDGDGMVECSPYNGGTSVVLDPAELYVKKPALDADGVLCREGDEVWEVRSHRRREIVGTHYRDYKTGEPLILCDGDEAIPIPATCVTHTKPEIDSWERIEEDARLKPLGYVDRVLGWDMSKSHSQNQARSAMARDLVRRAKALAERGE